MEVIYINDTLRVRSLDDLQYVLEKLPQKRKGNQVGKVRWMRLAYCVKVKSLCKAIEEQLRFEKIVEARKEAKKEWDESGVEKMLLSSLKDKGK